MYVLRRIPANAQRTASATMGDGNDRQIYWCRCCRKGARIRILANAHLRNAAPIVVASSLGLNVTTGTAAGRIHSRGHSKTAIAIDR